MQSQFFPIPTHEIPRVYKKNKKKKKKLKERHDREDFQQRMRERSRQGPAQRMRGRSRQGPRKDPEDPVTARNARAMAYGRRNRPRARSRADLEDPVRARNARAMAYGRRNRPRARSRASTMDSYASEVQRQAEEDFEAEEDIIFGTTYADMHDGSISSDSDPEIEYGPEYVRPPAQPPPRPVRGPPPPPPRQPSLVSLVLDTTEANLASQPLQPTRDQQPTRHQPRPRPGIGRRQEHAGPELRGPAGEELRGFADAEEPPSRQPRQPRHRGDRHHDHSGLHMVGDNFDSDDDDFPLAYPPDDVLNTHTARGLYHNIVEHPGREGLPLGPVPDGTNIRVHRPAPTTTPLNGAMNIAGAVGNGVNTAAQAFWNAINLDVFDQRGGSAHGFARDYVEDRGPLNEEQRREQEAEYDRLQREGRLAFPVRDEGRDRDQGRDRDEVEVTGTRTFDERYAAGAAAQGGFIEVDDPAENNLDEMEENEEAGYPNPYPAVPPPQRRTRRGQRMVSGLADSANYRGAGAQQGQFSGGF